MDSWATTIIEQCRGYRSRKLEPLGKLFRNIGIKAWMMTLLSFIFGLSAVYFLFTNYFWFVILALPHLFADALDGVIARVSTPTLYGKYLDFGTDQLITVLLVFKIGYFLQDDYIYWLGLLYLAAQIIHLSSRMQAPVLSTRTLIVLLLVVAVPLLPSIILLLLTSGVAGVTGLYSLARQLQWFLLEQKFSQR